MPKTVISVMRLAELNQITGDGPSGLRIGASVTLTDICEHPVINRDYPVVFGTLFIFSLIGLVVNLISDLAYMWIDPRIDFEAREV